MRRRRSATLERLTTWADQYVTPAERDRLGDDDAAILAEERWRERERGRPPVPLAEGDVSPVRPDVTAPEDRFDDPVVIEILAYRVHLISGRPGLPWKADR